MYSNHYFKPFITLLITATFIITSLSVLSFADTVEDEGRQVETPDAWHYLVDQGNEGHYFETDPSQFGWPDASYSNTDPRPNDNELGLGDTFDITYPEDVKWVCNNGTVVAANMSLIFDEITTEQSITYDEAKNLYVASGVVIAVDEDSIITLKSNFEDDKQFDYDRVIAVKDGFDVSEKDNTTGEIRDKRRLLEKDKTRINDLDPETTDAAIDVTTEEDVSNAQTTSTSIGAVGDEESVDSNTTNTSSDENNSEFDLETNEAEELQDTDSMLSKINSIFSNLFNSF